MEKCSNNSPVLQF